MNKRIYISFLPLQVITFRILSCWNDNKTLGYVAATLLYGTGACIDEVKLEIVNSVFVKLF